MNEAVVKHVREASEDPKIWLRVASERLSLTRYVFLVQIEDGIATAAQRASLEYADAVLIGWPEQDAEDVVNVDDRQLAKIHEQIAHMEGYIPRFQEMERTGNVDSLADTLIRITECVAEVRRIYQPDFPLPTFAEIRRVVQEEWDADMDRIDPSNSDPTVDDIERMKVETDHRHQHDGQGEGKASEA
ncbi:MAG: phosphoribosylglycinamide synthetase [Bifidobacterium sp.]|uniref:Phosphoribosylglycinamide synthetase n=1 Tax=Bifidobacterium fermentum TaxID=3059035 RepID=A0AB39UKW7_9BIFI